MSTPRTPVANKSASLIFFYYGDSKYETLGQETLRLKKAMEGYSTTVLLKHDSMPPWADLSEKDETIATFKAPPTKANFFRYLIDLAQDGHFIDLFLFTHGNTGSFRASAGSHGSKDPVTEDDIRRELDPARTGLSAFPIRIVWGTNCYGASLGDTWRAVGAKAATGAQFVNFYPGSYGPMIEDWNKGNVAFEDAVKGADTDAVRTVAQTYISLVDAPRQKKAGKWGGCSFGKTVLGDDPCARDYFLSCWIDKGEWDPKKSGKENMNASSRMIITGDGNLTKNSRPTWSGVSASAAKLPAGGAGGARVP